MKRSAWDWVLISYQVLIIALGLLLSVLIIRELIGCRHDLLRILHLLGLAVLLYGIIDRSPLSFRGLEVSLSFPIVLVVLLLSADRFPAAPRIAVFAATGIAVLGSLVSESLRRLSRPRLPVGRSLARVLFYATCQALVGFAAAQAYLRVQDLGLGQAVEQLSIQPTLAYTLVYALAYSLASRIIVSLHDWAISRLLLPADERKFPRVDLLTLGAIAPLPLALVYFFSGESGWVLMTVSFAIYLGFVIVARSYFGIEERERHGRAMEDLRRQFGTLVNMRELGDKVCTILSRRMDYRWAAVYSAGPDRSDESDINVYHLRGKLEKTKAGNSIDHYEPRIREERKRVLATVTEELPSAQAVNWPCQVVGGEGHHLGKVIRTGQPSPSIRGEGEEPASASDPYIPPQTIGMYLPVRYGGKTIGLLALTRSLKRFTDRERGQLERLSKAMSESLWQIQRVEAQLQELYSDAEEYTTDPVKFQRVVRELTDARVDVSLILDIITQSTFRDNVLSVMQCFVEPHGASEQERLLLSEERLREIYAEARLKRPDMPELNAEILENLKLIPASLSLAFSFRYKWSRSSRGSEYKPLYEFMVNAMKAKSVSDIAGLSSKEIDSTVQKLKADARFSLQVIRHLEAVGQVVECLEQDCLIEAIDQTTELNYSVDERIADPERSMFRSLLRHWRTIISATIAEREGAARMGRAELNIALRSKYALPLPLGPVTVGLRVENAGPGSAFQVAVEIVPAPDYQVRGESQINLGMLPPMKTHDLEFTIEPRESRELSLQFQITYRDPEQKQRAFKDTLHLREAPPLFTYVPSPYIPGMALRMNSEVFVGREEVFQFINQNMDSSVSQQRVLLLIGERRMGKTSILKQLPACVQDKGYVHVFCDCQAIGGTPDVASFFRRLATDICNALQREGFSIDRPSAEHIRNDAYCVFEQQLLPQVWERIGNCCLLIAVDEFERLDRCARPEVDEVDFAAPLRALMQHQDRLAFVFTGTHQLEALSSGYWSFLFNMAQYKEIGFLEEEEARQLVTERVQGCRVHDDLALEEILRATGRHPYFLQLMCNHLMHLCNTKRRSYVTLQDVRDASEKILATGQAHLTFIWDKSDPTERDVLAGLAKSLATDARATVDTIVGHLERAGRPRARPEVREALQRLEIRRHIVARDPGPGDIGYYSFTADLYRLWIQRYHSLD